MEKTLLFAHIKFFGFSIERDIIYLCFLYSWYYLGQYLNVTNISIDKPILQAAIEIWNHKPGMKGSWKYPVVNQ